MTQTALFQGRSNSPLLLRGPGPCQHTERALYSIRWTYSFALMQSKFKAAVQMLCVMTRWITITRWILPSTATFEISLLRPACGHLSDIRRTWRTLNVRGNHATTHGTMSAMNCVLGILRIWMILWDDLFSVWRSMFGLITPALLPCFNRRINRITTANCNFNITWETALLRSQRHRNAGMILISYQKSIKMIAVMNLIKHFFFWTWNWEVSSVHASSGVFSLAHPALREGGNWLLSVTETPLHTFKTVLCISRFSVCDTHWLITLRQHLATPEDNSICRQEHVWL